MGHRPKPFKSRRVERSFLQFVRGFSAAPPGLIPFFVQLTAHAVGYHLPSLGDFSLRLRRLVARTPNPIASKPRLAYLDRVKAYQEFEINYFQDEDGMFTAEVPAIRGCVAWGKTIVEAYNNAVDAIESCLEAREKIGAKKPRKPRYSGVNIYRRPVDA